MPRYDYRCTACGHEYELKQSFSDKPVSACEQCGAESRRVIHSVPVVFKGSGFYVNDYGKGGGANGGANAKSDSENDSDSDSKESSDSKRSSDSKESSDSKRSSESKESKKTESSKDKATAAAT